MTHPPPPEATAAADLVGRDAAEILAAFKAGRVCSRDLVAAHLARLDAVDPHLRAVAARRDEAVLAAAAEIDAARDAGRPLGPLAGAPVSIKDTYAMAGWSWSCGLAERADIVADQDAALVTRLRDAGAVPFVRSTTSPATMLYETVNRLTGHTRNPWDRRAALGGSSGGEAALVAVGGSPWGVGSDLGGSVRLPAHAAGVVGLLAGRPGSAAIPTRRNSCDNWPACRSSGPRRARSSACRPGSRRFADVGPKRSRAARGSC